MKAGIGLKKSSGGQLWNGRSSMGQGFALSNTSLSLTVVRPRICRLGRMMKPALPHRIMPFNNRTSLQSCS